MMQKLRLNKPQFSTQINSISPTFLYRKNQSVLFELFCYQAYDTTRIKKKIYTDFINRWVCPIYIIYYHKQHTMYS